MFGFRKKKSYEAEIRLALEKGRTDDAARIAHSAFKDGNADEGTLAWVAAAMFERDVRSAFDLLERFVELFPASLHLPRVYMADVLARGGHFDAATDQARVYLRQARDAGVFADLSSLRVLREGVSKAFLLLTAAYTELGARSYSKRVLNYARQFQLSESWAGAIDAEMTRLKDELQNHENAALDHKWEQFFERGIAADELYKLCLRNECPLLGKRIDLIESNFRFNATFRVDEAEILMLVLSTTGDEHLLH